MNERRGRKQYSSAKGAPVYLSAKGAIVAEGLVTSS